MYLIFLGIYQPFKIEKFAAIQYHVKRRTILTSPSSGSLRIPNLAAQELVVNDLFITTFDF